MVADKSQTPPGRILMVRVSLDGTMGLSGAAYMRVTPSDYPFVTEIGVAGLGCGRAVTIMMGAFWN
jgi:hypothetical protein